MPKVKIYLTKMKLLFRNKYFWLLLLVCSFTLLPFLGLSDFHTKGEPREAIVSYTMLDSDNWVLPTNMGGETAYKPPFFHWCVAVASSVYGTVTEATSRIPSAVALLIMTMATFVFFAKRKGNKIGAITALTAFTSFELHRAGSNCRVDMVLTMLTVCAIYDLMRWYEHKMKGIPWIAIVLMGLGTMTKGPVGSIIPCMVMGIFMLMRKVNFFRAFFTLVAFGLLSLLIYGAWFYAAYRQGGQSFLDLMYEENIGRMTNTMSYDSCVNPWPYNFLTVFTGYLPWILLLITTLFFVRWNFKKNINLKSIWNGILGMDNIDLYSLIATVSIFVFYCIPQSKRSVYLMPIYPFLAYFIAKLLVWLSDSQQKPLRIYGGILSVLSTLLFVVFALIKSGVAPLTILGGHGKHAITNIATMQAFANIGSWWQYVLILATTVIGLAWWRYQKRHNGDNLVYGIIALTFALYLSVDGVYTPAALNVKSQRPLAGCIDRIAPESKGKIYEYIDYAIRTSGDKPHFFELNYYLNNRVHNFYKEKPQSGFLVITHSDYEMCVDGFNKEGYKFKFIKNWVEFDMDLYQFNK